MPFLTLSCLLFTTCASEKRNISVISLSKFALFFLAVVAVAQVVVVVVVSRRWKKIKNFAAKSSRRSLRFFFARDRTKGR